MPWPHRNLTTLGSAAGPAPQAHPNSQSVPFPDGEREADPLSFVAAPGSPSPGHEARLVVAALRRSRPLMLHLAALAIRLATRTRAQSSGTSQSAAEPKRPRQHRRALQRLCFGRLTTYQAE